MRYTFLIIFFLNNISYGQRRIDHEYETKKNLIYEQFRKEDSIEENYSDDSILKIITDTVLQDPTKEQVSLADWRIVLYYFDSTEMIKKIIVKDHNDKYYFYYYENLLRKSRYLNLSRLTVFKYYYNKDDNEINVFEDTKQKSENIEKKDFNLMLQMGKSFYEKSKTMH